MVVGVLTLVAWELRDFLMMLIAGALRANSWQDVIGLMLVPLTAVIIVGDYAYYAIAVLALGQQVGQYTEVYVHLLTHILVSIIFLIRISTLVLFGSKVAPRLWRRASTRDAKLLLVFAVAGIVDTGYYVLRHNFSLVFPNLGLPWKGFWIHCAIVAGLTWTLAGLAFWLSARWSGIREGIRSGESEKEPTRYEQ